MKLSISRKCGCDSRVMSKFSRSVRSACVGARAPVLPLDPVGLGLFSANIFTGYLSKEPLGSVVKTESCDRSQQGAQPNRLQKIILRKKRNRKKRGVFRSRNG